MSSIRHAKVFGAAFCFLLVPTVISAQETCAVDSGNEQLGQIEATADIAPNLFKRAGSLRYESERLLKEAAKIAQSKSPPAECVQACDGTPKAEVVFSSNPLQVKGRYAGMETCAEKSEQTGKTPFIVSDRRFGSIEEAAGWIQDFTQGKGEEGERLYDACSGGCSPRYTFFVTPTKDAITLEASVRCGHARDRDDNRYLLTAAYRWTC